MPLWTYPLLSLGATVLSAVWVLRLGKKKKH